ncbi:MAG: hypothetical protein ACK4KW_09515 [Gemmobacter sp.]
MRILFGLALWWAAAAAAETPMTGAEFEARTSGQTLDFAVRGEPYGTEQYLPGRRVIWAFSGGQCRYGKWYEDGTGRICFVYEHDPTPQCWWFFDRPGGIAALFDGDQPGSELVEVRRSSEPMACPGPDVGV